jgi:transcriptional regulator with XRE-family HTH domain
MPDLGDVVAANVRGWRARHRLRQADLAERTGWSKDTISDIETGRRRIGIADMPVLCEALEVGLVDLLHGADPADLRKLRLS